MYTSVPIFSRQTHRDRHKRRHAPSHIKPLDEQHISVVNKRLPTIRLRRRRAQETRSFYDNTEEDENEHIVSKWTIVRQRLPDILALSTTYKPTSIRAQLVLLVALMNRETTELQSVSHRLNTNEYNNTVSHIVPNNVIIDISGRSRLICLKRIPSNQMIHVDVDGLSFSIPSRQFILAISHGFTHETATRYCPPAISDMLIDISKAKIIDDRRQYKRAQFKLRISQITFFVVFILIITMVFVIIIGATNTVIKINLFNDTSPFIPIEPITSGRRT